MARLTLYQAPRGKPLLSVEKSSINAVEAYIRWLSVECPKYMHIGTNILCQQMAYVNQSEARRMSFGPHDPREQNPNAAWRLPVRRISERYYRGWKVKPIMNGWMLFNDSREAYFIEFGISRVGFSWAIRGDRQERLGPRRTPTRRIRRPVRKLSLIRTLKYMASTQAYHRIWSEIYTTRQHVAGFTQKVQSPGMGSFSGPMLGRRLPG